MTITPPMTPTIAPPMGPRDRVTRLLRSVREVSVLWRDVSRVAFPAGSSGLGVLHLVEQHGPMRVSDLATGPAVSSSTGCFRPCRAGPRPRSPGSRTS